MAWQDRDYNREDEYGTGNGLNAGIRGKSVVLWLLGINVVIWLADRVFTGSSRASAVSPYYWFNFNVDQAVNGFQVWRWITYQFVHSLTDFIHIFFNMMILLVLGPSMEQWWGSKRFLVFYLVCGVSGAVVFCIMYYVGILSVSVYSPLVGASGSIYGICVGAATAYPTQRLKMLWLPFEFRLRTFAWIILGIAVLSVLVGSQNAGGEAAHLGGAVLGFILVKFPRSLDWADRLSPTAIQANVNAGRFERKKKAEANEQAEVDRILDKVRDQGLASLTNREKKTLQRATERGRGG